MYRNVIVFLPFGVSTHPLNVFFLQMASVAVVLSTHCCTRHLFFLRYFFVVFNHSKLEGVKWKPSMILSPQPQLGILPVRTCNNGDCSENLRWYISSTSCSPELAIYRLPSSRLLAIRARVGRLLASPYPLTLLLALHQSLTSSTIRTSCPTLPRLSVGGGRIVPVPMYPRGSPWPLRFRMSPGLPSTHSRVVTARSSPARPPLVAIPDRFKGEVPSMNIIYTKISYVR